MRPSRVSVDATRFPLARMRMAGVIIAEMIASDDCGACAMKGFIERVVPRTARSGPAGRSFTGVSSQPKASVRLRRYPVSDMITRAPSDPEVTLLDEPPEDDQPRRPARGGPGRRWWILPIIVIILIVAVWLIVRLVNGGAKAPRYVTAPVGYQTIRSTVEETGTVNPVNQVDVGTQVSGTIATLGVDFNSIVHKGQVLATLDPTSLEAASLQAHENAAASQSSAAAARSTAAQSGSAVQSAQANVAKAAAALKLAQATVARDRQLLAQG